MKSPELYIYHVVNSDLQNKVVCVTDNKDEVIETIKNIDGNYSIRVFFDTELIDIYDNVSEEEFRKLL